MFVVLGKGQEATWGLNLTRAFLIGQHKCMLDAQAMTTNNITNWAQQAEEAQQGIVGGHVRPQTRVIQRVSEHRRVVSWRVELRSKHAPIQDARHFQRAQASSHCLLVRFSIFARTRPAHRLFQKIPPNWRFWWFLYANELFRPTWLTDGRPLSDAPMFTEEMWCNVVRA